MPSTNSNQSNQSGEVADKQSNSKTKRTPIERLLPNALIVEITEHLTDLLQPEDDVSRKLTQTLYDEFKIRSCCGVTVSRFRNFLKRIHKKRNRRDSVHIPSEIISVESEPLDKKTEKEPDWSVRLADHRRRQASIATILERLFGPLSKCATETWAHRTYLLLVGEIYYRLAAGKSELPTDELVAFAKVLAEHRRIEVQMAKALDGTEKEQGKISMKRDHNRTVLPTCFPKIVRDIYGTNFHPPDESIRDNEATGANKSTKSDKSR